MYDYEDDIRGNIQNIKAGKKNIKPGKAKKPKKYVPRSKKIKRAIIITVVIAAILGIGTYLVLGLRLFGTQLSADLGHSDEIKEKTVNFLVLGIDNDEGREELLNTDVIMVLNLDVPNKTARILQIPRDTWIGPKETTYGKINGIYGRKQKPGGINGLAEFLHDNYKINIDHYATVTMATFKQVVDDIGGVKMHVPFTINLEGVKIPRGDQLLTGEQAERLVRKRKDNSNYKEGDLDRLKMQRRFIAALASELKQSSMPEFVNIISNASPNVKTDLTLGEILKYAKFLKDIDLKEMKIYFMPGESAIAYPNGYKQSVYSLHRNASIDMLNKYFRPYQDPITKDDVTIPEISNTGKYYEDTQDNLDALSKGKKPAKKKK